MSLTDDELKRRIDAAARAGVTQLDLSYQGIRSLPPAIGKLEDLVVLDLCGNDLTSLAPEMGHLRRLAHLDLRHNRLAALPPEVGLLTSLVSLDLRDNRLTTLPPEMETLISLSSLDLRQNRIEIFPQVMLSMLGLEELHLWSNPLTDMPVEMARLKRLSLLNLGGSEMSEIPPGIWRLTHLERLILDATNVSAIPPEIMYLRGLEYLDLHGNRIGVVPPEIGELGHLLTLILHHNSITHLPPEIGDLRELRQLDLHCNHLVSLPREIGRLTNLELLDLTENPVSIPPEILARSDDPPTVLTYHLEHLGGEKQSLNEAKMVLVGQPDVGKTSLVRRLITGAYDPREPKTEGIAIQRWHIDINETEVQLNVWDFGGQEIMHATHQFFLTKRTLYLLVLDNRLSEEENRLEYWLKIIQSFGGDSPIIIVTNKTDQQLPDLDARGLQEKYPQICDIVATSCATGQGLDKLKARIAREVVRMPHVRDALLASWFEVKREIEEMDQDYVSYDRYIEICEAHAVTDTRSQRTLLGFLHDLGLVLSFRDDPRLSETNILNPRWVTQGVYQILNDDDLMQKQGRLERADLDDILDPVTYPKSKQHFILDMMRKFELCFAFEDESGRFLVPDLLPKEAPATGNWRGALGFEYHYNVLPSSVFSRFLVRMQAYLYEDTLWRHGAVVADQDNFALVEADREERRIVIRVRGPETTRRHLLSVIRYHLDVIHSSISGIQVEERVPLTDHPDVTVSRHHLLNLRAMGESSFVPPGLRQRRDVRSLLDRVDLPPETREAVRLRQILVERLDLDELRALCRELAVEFGSLSSVTKSGKAQELVTYLARGERLEELMRAGQWLRPDVTWRPRFAAD